MDFGVSIDLQEELLIANPLDSRFERTQLKGYVRGAPGGKKGVISEAPLGRERFVSMSVTSSRVIWLLELRSRREKASRIERI